MSLRATLIGAGIALVAILGFIWHYIDLRSDLTDAQERAETAEMHVETLEAAIASERDAVAARDGIVDTINKEEADGLIQTEEALGRNPGWAAEPVPVDVLDSLRR